MDLFVFLVLAVFAIAFFVAGALFAKNEHWVYATILFGFAFASLFGGQPWVQGFLKTEFLSQVTGVGEKLNEFQEAVVKQTEELRVQKKELQDVKGLVRSILGATETESFSPPDTGRVFVDRRPVTYRETDRTQATGNFVCMLLKRPPIPTTVQPRFASFFDFPPTRIATEKNLVCVLLNRADVSFVDPGDEMTVTYIPDPIDADSYASVQLHDNDLYADGEQMPRGLGLMDSSVIVDADAPTKKPE